MRRLIATTATTAFVASTLLAVPAAQSAAAPLAGPGCTNTLYVVEFEGAGGTGSIRTVNTTTNMPFGKRIAIGKTPGSIVINPQGTTAYVTNNGGGISVIDLQTRAVIATVADDAIPTNIAMSPDGSTVYVANAKSTGPDLTIINTADNSATSQDLAVPGAYGVAVNADGTGVYVSAFSQSDTNVYFYETSDWTEPAAVIPTGARNKEIVLSPDGSQLWVAANSADRIQVIDTATHTLLKSIAVGNKPERITFTPNGATAWVTNIGTTAKTPNISIINTASLTVTKTIQGGPLPFDVAFTPNGATAYVANSLGQKGTFSPAGTVTVINTATGAITKRIRGFVMPDNLVVCSPRPL
ncbi:MAG: YncE family protein [Candidatus Nanopelagicales bacterium]